MKKEEIDSYLQRTDITIEGNTATWNIAANGLVNGTYLGSFRFKCYLTPTEKLSCGRDYRQLLGSNMQMASPVESNLAFSLSQLKHRIISAPPFWSSALGLSGIPGDLPDENIIDIVLEAAVTAEVKYLAQLEEQKKSLLDNAQKSAEAILSQKDNIQDEQNDKETD